MHEMSNPIFWGKYFKMPSAEIFPGTLSATLERVILSYANSEGPVSVYRTVGYWMY